MTAPTLTSIREAKERLHGVIHATPLAHSTSLSEEAGMDLRFKPENLQITGSFKIRGAFNKIKSLVDAGAKGVVTASSGNHGQAVAWAARYFGLPARIIVPTTAPAIKVASARAFGAEVEFFGTRSRERLERAEQVAQELGYVFVPPYDDAWVMSGQGTLGLEILQEWPDVEAVVVPIGGGGLISGIATAIKETRPDVRVIGVEPEGAAKAFQSRQQGRRVELPGTESLADGLITLALGHLTHPIVERYVDDLYTVSEEAIQQTLWRLMTRLKLVVEPSGAVTSAFLLSEQGRARLGGRRVVAVISGGNVDPEVLRTIPVQ
ncbi:threonine ammonia-lyase [Sulfobacillus harzensis]|uniref:threonine ammonia-lyase n=1 Tax=Sulfobacillus harzensis TaxID=2729629 RepID=A0A7Y0L2Y1_9FIRM|nr:threonine/serine dehydratase [Sulfobacillus harzensis]NMP21761.1 pyridoxal-phosphate dependent enzyme [Sulfobacillus harzensis]